MFTPTILGNRSPAVGELGGNRVDLAAEDETSLLHRALEIEDIVDRALREQRARIASALHESVAQGLTSVTLQADIAGSLVDRDPAMAKELIGEIRAQAASACDGLRSAVADLAAPLMDKQTLIEALRGDIDAFAETSGLTPSFVTSGEIGVGLADLELATTFVREALTNVAKHARGVRRVSVRVTFSSTTVSVWVRDDGRVPDDASTHRAPAGHGIDVLRLRARLRGGDVTFTQEQGWGTEVAIEIPV